MFSVKSVCCQEEIWQRFTQKIREKPAGAKIHDKPFPIQRPKHTGHQTVMYLFHSLKILTNEKRGGLKVVTFDRSPFKVFSLRFSKKSVQAPSCKRTKTTQRTLFLSFEMNNCFPITV
jgi:hypothetical protein